MAFGLKDSLHDSIHDELDDFDPDEIDDTVKEVRRMSLTGGPNPATPRVNRGSMLTGFAVPQQKMKRGILRNVMKSMRKLGS